AVPDLEVERRTVGAVHEVMAVGDARRETRGHPRAERLLARVGDQRDLPVEDVDELVLARVPVPLRRPGARAEAPQVDAEVREPDRVAERALGAVAARGVERRRIRGPGLLGHGRWIERRHVTPSAPVEDRLPLLLERLRALLRVLG